MLDRPIIPHKGELIETAHSILAFRSFADLGACWGVNGGYSFHAASIAGEDLERGCIVDQNITPLTRERAAAAPKIELITAMLGSDEARKQVDKVDALIMYDILLHQVKPDWDTFLVDWLPHTNMLITYNQNWTKTDETVRFVDQGYEWYRENVVYVNEESLRKWFDEHDTFDEGQQKLKRDIHNYWQWGITAADMISLLEGQGFELKYQQEYGPMFTSKPWLVNEALIFVRSGIL